VSDEPKIKSKWTTRQRLLFAAVLLTGVIMVVILPGIFWQLHEANQTLHGFSDALIAKRYGQAYDLTSRELRTVTDYGTFVKVHEDLNLRLGDFKNIKINQSNVKGESDGWYARIDARMIFARGSLPFFFVLKREENHWKIYSYHEQ
jgi:hypothetical protein